MLDRSLERQLLAGVGALAGAAALSGGIGLWKTVSLREQLGAAEQNSAIMRNHMQADMMHDALRGDVYMGLAIASGQSKISANELAEVLTEHANIFRQTLEENKQLAGNSELRGLFDEIGPALESYSQAASAIVRKAATGQVEPAALSSFDAAFTQLEGVMEKAADRIEAQQKAANESAHKEAEFAWILVLSAILLAACFSVAIAIVVRTRIVAPLTNITAVMRKLAGGDTTVALPALERKDEIGDIAAALVDFKANAVERARLEAEELAKLDNDRQRQRGLEDVIGQFRASMEQRVRSALTNARTNVDAARTMAGSSQTAQTLSETASSTAQETAQDMQSIAAATEQLSASVREIAERAQESSRETIRARDVSRQGELEIKQLGEVTAKITSVVDIIQNIAVQTNLLALNATIEAARAGQAGRGFAVVAAEVKTLAEQTAAATQQITAMIEGVRQSAGAVDQSFGAAISAIAEIETQINSVASAVEQQNATTSEITGSVARVSQGSQQTAVAIGDLSSTAADAKHAADQMQDSSEAIESASQNIAQEIDSFIATINRDLENQRAQLRLQMRRRVTIAIGAARYRGDIRSITETAATIVVRGQFAVGDQVELIWPHLEAARGRIVRASDNEIAVQFATALRDPLSNAA